MLLTTVLGENKKKSKYNDCDEDEEDIKTFNVLPNKDEILQMYLKDIGKKKMLKPDEELKIAKIIQEGSARLKSL